MMEEPRKPVRPTNRQFTAEDVMPVRPITVLCAQDEKVDRYSIPCRLPGKLIYSSHKNKRVTARFLLPYQSIGKPVTAQ